MGHLPSRQGLIPKFEPIAGRDSATPIGPGLNAAELRKLQELAAERMESQNARLFVDDRPSTANPTGFIRHSADQVNIAGIESSDLMVSDTRISGSLDTIFFIVHMQ